MKTIFNFIITIGLSSFVLGFVLGCYRAPDLSPAAVDPNAQPPAVALGERLSREARFAQFFAVHTGGDVNTAIVAGDPILATTETRNAPLPGPYAAGGMTCRACHLLDEQLDQVGGGMRSYADFSRRSPIPVREDGRTHTARNTPTMVSSTSARDGALFLHFDGQFTSAAELVRATFTGRNFGWLPNEYAQAVAQVAKVVREDDGRGVLAGAYGSLAYRDAIAGVGWLSDGARIPPELRLNVNTATDEEILDGVARLVAAYLDSLVFARDDGGDFNGSPYDLFLARNNLPRHPNSDETPLDYSRRLRQALAALAQPRFVGPDDGTFKFHVQPFQFGASELAGLQLFLAEQSSGLAQGSVGNCATCHTPPAFTDYRFHNTGASQLEYDDLHGKGTFASLTLPDLTARNADPARYLPPSATTPQALAIFAAAPAAELPGHADLGLWNVFANPALPGPQAALRALLCTEAIPSTEGECRDESILPSTVARFKTPTLRDLGQSPPYLHNGQLDTLEEVIAQYIQAANLVRQGQLVNGAVELNGIALNAADIAPLAAFLRSLNEDYH